MWDPNSNKMGTILMASRQLGKTVFTEATICWLILFHSNYPVMVMSRDQPQGTDTIIEIKDMLKRLPEWMAPEFTIDQAMHFKLSNGSEVKLQASNNTTDKTSSKGRGKRPLFIWVDEAAFLHLDLHLKAIIPAASETSRVAKQKGIPCGIVFSSTPNGRVGKGAGFYNMWTASTNNTEESAYTPLRIHWSEIPTKTQEWYNAEREKYVGAQDIDRIMNQEYDLVFLGSEDSVLPDHVVKQLQDKRYAADPLKTIEYPHGYISYFDMIDNEKRYVVGVDTSSGDGNDYHAFTVMDYESDQVLVEGRFKGCEVSYYNDYYLRKVLENIKYKAIIVEKNGVGKQSVEKLTALYGEAVLKDKLNSSNSKTYGFTSSASTRPLVVEQIIKTCKENNENLKSYNMRFEASTLERKAGGKIEGHPNDDLIFSYAFCKVAKQYYSLEELNVAFNFEVETAVEMSDELFALMDVDDFKSDRFFDKPEKREPDGIWDEIGEMLV